MKSRMNQNEKSNRTMRICVYVILALIAAAFVLGSLQLFGKGKTKPSNWGDQTPTAEAEGGLEIEAPENDDAKIQTTVNIIPRKLYAQYGIMPIAETAMQVTATIGTGSDAAAEDGKLDWQLVWKDPQSEWATGKTVSEYVTIQVNEDTLTATLSCLQAFGEQLQLTAQIKTNAAVKSAPRTVNYVQRFVSLDKKVTLYSRAVNPVRPKDQEIVMDGTSGLAKLTFQKIDETYAEFNNWYSRKTTMTYMTAEFSIELSEVYTKEATVEGQISVANTAKYFEILNQAGGTTTLSAEEYRGTKNGMIRQIDFMPIENGEAMDWALFKRLLSEAIEEALFTVKLEVTVNEQKHEVTFDGSFSANFGTFANSVDIGSGDIDFVG